MTTRQATLSVQRRELRIATGLPGAPRLLVSRGVRPPTRDALWRARNAKRRSA